MDKISIIIPVYNVESYIKKCLDSVINQTYKNLEILLIDDGSPDNCGKICDDYAKLDNRIRVFHKEHGGLSSALNVGLKNFTGDYLGFVDSDDWVEPDMYMVLYTVINTENAAVSVCSYFKDTDIQSVPMKNKNKILDKVISPKDMLLYPLKRDYYVGFCGYVWNKLYSASAIRKSGLLFDEDIKYAMDVLFYTTLVLNQKARGVYVDKPLYHYLQRDTAISKSKSISIKSDILKVYKRVEYLLENNGYSDINFWARGFYCHHASVIAEIAIKNNNMQTLKLMQGEIREHLDDYIKTNKEFSEKFERIYKLLNEY